MIRRLLSSAGLLAIALLLGNARPAAAQHPKIFTHKSSPSVVIAQPGTSRVHVLTAGVDAGFDRILNVDSGDVAPRWFVIDSDTRAVIDSATFDAFFNSYPIRVGFDGANAKLYAAQSGRIRAYDINTLELVDDTVARGDYSGVSYDAFARIIIAHMRPGFSTEGYIVGLDPATADTLGVYLVGVNPQMTVSEYDPANLGIATYTLSEGSFGAPNALLSYAGGNPDIYRAMNGRPVGVGIADVLSYSNDVTILTAIAAGASNRVRVLDSRTHREIASIAVPAPSALGADIEREELLVGSSGGWLYRIADGISIADSFALPGPAGAIAVRTGLAAVAIPYRDATMSAPSTSIVLVNTADGIVVDTIDVGRQPLRIFFDNRGDLHVIVADSAGVSRWIQLDRATFVQTTERFVPGLHAKRGVAYDAISDSVFFIQKDPASGRNVIATAVSETPDISRVLYDDSTAAGELVALNTGAGSHLLALERARTSEHHSYLHVLRMRDGVRVVKALSGDEPIEAAPTAPGSRGSFGVYVASEAASGAMLGQVGFKQNMLGSDTLGRGANHIRLSTTSGPAAVTMNGGHEIVVVDMTDAAVRLRMPTGTSGFDGPREAVEIVGSLVPGYVVTTYAGDVRFLDAAGPYRIEPTDGKAEGIARVGDVFYVANAFTPEYGPDSTVVIIGLVSGVAESMQSTHDVLAQNIPNPASTRTRLRIAIATSSHVRIDVHSVSGELVSTPLDGVMNAGTYDIDMSVADLAVGAYVYTLRTGGTVTSRLMQVIR